MGSQAEITFLYEKTGFVVGSYVIELKALYGGCSCDLVLVFLVSQQAETGTQESHSDFFQLLNAGFKHV